jgi:hypothetical protein
MSNTGLHLFGPKIVCDPLDKTNSIGYDFLSAAHSVWVVVVSAQETGETDVKKLYLLLAGLGLIGPYYFLVQFLAAHGLNLPLLVEQLFANSISTFFAVDLLITAIVFWVWSYREARQYSIGSWWLFVVATLTIGPSFAFPLLLVVRQSRRQISV